MTSSARFWLMKSEPGVYSIDDLAEAGQDCWEGVRNYQARNFMRDDMRDGDWVIFYHSNAKPSGAAGVARICREAYPDAHAWDPRSPYFDPKSTPDNPRWVMVDVCFVEKFAQVLALTAMRADPALADMALLQKGQRLSIMPIAQRHFETIVVLAGGKTRV